MSDKKVKKSQTVGVKHRYEDLIVEEISVVDLPANEHHFAVIKCKDGKQDKNVNKEDQTMADKNVEKSEEKKTTGDSVVVPVEVVKSEDDKAMEKVLQELAKIEKTVSSFASEEKEKEEEKEEELSEEKFESALKASGINGVALEQAMEKYREIQKEETKKPTKEEEKEEPKVVEKSEEKEEEELNILGDLSQALEKAKTFTPSRIEAIKQALETLQKLMAGIESVPHGKSPRTKAPSTTSFGSSGLTSLTKAVENIQKSVSTMANKLEKIEKTQLPSSSLGENEEVKKNNDEDFWATAL